MGGACGTYLERRVACRVFVEKPKGKRRRGKPRRRWEYNIKGFFKIWIGGERSVDWIDLAQDRDM